MHYDFLVETYETERIKVVSTWSECRDEEMPLRSKTGDPRGRSVHEQMVHQCVSEDLWMRTMLGIDVGAPPLPKPETTRIYPALCGGPRQAARCTARKRRSVVARRNQIFRCVAIARLGDDAPHRAHSAPSRATNRNASNVGPRPAQQLWSDGRYWGADAESRTNHLRVF